MKGTGLGKQDFKDPEEEMILMLYKNHMNDPKLTDEERNEVKIKAEAILER